MSSSRIDTSGLNPAPSGFWSRFSDALEQLSLSYSELLERRVTRLEAEVAALMAGKSDGSPAPGNWNREKQ